MWTKTSLCLLCVVLFTNQWNKSDAYCRLPGNFKTLWDCVLNVTVILESVHRRVVKDLLCRMWLSVKLMLTKKGESISISEILALEIVFLTFRALDVNQEHQLFCGRRSHLIPETLAWCTTSCGMKTIIHTPCDQQWMTYVLIWMVIRNLLFINSSIFLLNIFHCINSHYYCNIVY